jgi:hypothetical protein
VGRGRSGRRWRLPNRAQNNVTRMITRGERGGGTDAHHLGRARTAEGRSAAVLGSRDGRETRRPRAAVRGVPTSDGGTALRFFKTCFGRAETGRARERRGVPKIHDERPRRHSSRRRSSTSR